MEKHFSWNDKSVSTLTTSIAIKYSKRQPECGMCSSETDNSLPHNEKSFKVLLILVYEKARVLCFQCKKMWK